MKFEYIKNKINKILIIMPFYNRHDMVIDALNSIRQQSYKNWILAFLDDGSEKPGELTVKDFLNEEELSKTKFYSTGDTIFSKKERTKEYPITKEFGITDTYSGLHLTPHFNKIMIENEYDIAIFLCDDDILYENYLYNLNDFYNKNTEIVYSYSDIALFDRTIGRFDEFSTFDHRYNKIGAIRGALNLDTTQVSWRSKATKEDNVLFPETYCLYFDAHWFEALYKKYGLCEPNFLISQYKQYGISKSISLY